MFIGIKECYREFCESILKDFKNGNASFDTIGISTVISSRFSQNIWSTNKGIKRDISGNITKTILDLISTESIWSF
ncbi:MAG: hypothetical protein IPH57_07575 [Saprospiraceae bacterium]|nr:hypothetical protein [Saprospiraceae bacterium]